MKGTYGANKPSIMAWREEHKEQYLEYMRNYNETNKLRIREQMKQKYDENGKQKALTDTWKMLQEIGEGMRKIEG